MLPSELLGSRKKVGFQSRKPPSGKKVQNLVTKNDRRLSCANSMDDSLERPSKTQLRHVTTNRQKIAAPNLGPSAFDEGIIAGQQIFSSLAEDKNSQIRMPN